jgi:hypothetical protein
LAGINEIPGQIRRILAEAEAFGEAIHVEVLVHQEWPRGWMALVSRTINGG